MEGRERLVLIASVVGPCPLISLSEYHLVAGGEELFLETGLLAPVKQEDNDMGALSPADTDESNPWSPITPSTGGGASPLLDYPGLLTMPSESNMPGSPASPVDTIALPRLASMPRGRSSSLPGLHRRYTAPTPSPLAPRPASYGFEQPSPQLTQATAVPPSAPTYTPSLASFADQPPPLSHCAFLAPPPINPPLPIRLSSIELYAEGMAPFTFSVSSILANHPADQPAPRLIIQIKIRLPSIDDVNGFPTLHGILGSVTFTQPWVTSTNCITDVYAAGVHYSRENAELQPVSDEPCGSATLPESELTRCRWLDACTCLFVSSRHRMLTTRVFSERNVYLPANHRRWRDNGGHCLQPRPQH